MGACWPSLSFGQGGMAPTIFRTVVVSVLSSAVTTMLLYNVQVGTLDSSAVLAPMQRTFGWQPSVPSSNDSERSGDGGPSPHRSTRASLHSLGPSFAPQARASNPLTAEEVRNLRTSYNCRRMGAWGDVCTYENVCYDGSFLYFLEPGAAPLPKETAAFYCDGDLYEGLIFPRREDHDRQEHRLPFNGGSDAGKYVDPAFLTSGNASVKWMNKVFWLMPMHYSLNNIWYLASRTLPLFKARRMNESGLFDPPLPSLHPKHAFVYIPHPKQEFDFDWFQQLFAVASGGAKLNFKNTLDQELDDDHWMCFRQAVLPGTFGGVIPDVQTGFEFREAMYKRAGLELPRKPPKKVLFWFRKPPLYRTILNTDELLRITSKYGVSFSLVVDFPTSFRGQLELFATHGVVVAPHGAGLVNEMFFVPGGSVVEIFPFHLDHNLYRTLAATMGLGYFPVHTFNGSDVWSRHQAQIPYNCDALDALTVNNLEPNCRTGSIFFHIYASTRDFEPALVNALQHAGIKAKYGGFATVEDPDWMQ